MRSDLEIKQSTIRTGGFAYLTQLVRSFIFWGIRFFDRRNKSTGLKGLVVYSGDLIGQEIVLNGLFERTELELLFKWLADNKFIVGAAIDIGANIGNHSVFFSKYYDKVYSYEPHPITFKILEINALQNTNIVCYSFGASNADKTATIYTVDGSMGGASLHPHATDEAMVSQQIQLKPLDLQEDLQNVKVGLIKVDVEGHELFALMGAQQLIMKNRPVIVFEQHPTDFVGDSTPTINFLKSIGYDSFAHIEATPTLPFW